MNQTKNHQLNTHTQSPGGYFYAACLGEAGACCLRTEWREKGRERGIKARAAEGENQGNEWGNRMVHRLKTPPPATVITQRNSNGRE